MVSHHWNMLCRTGRISNWRSLYRPPTARGSYANNPLPGSRYPRSPNLSRMGTGSRWPGRAGRSSPKGGSTRWTEQLAASRAPAKPQAASRSLFPRHHGNGAGLGDVDQVSVILVLEHFDTVFLGLVAEVTFVELSRLQVHAV